MRNIIIKSISFFFVTAMLVSCGEHDDVVYDPNTGQTFVFFSEDGSNINFDQSMPETGSVEVQVAVSNLSSSARTVQLSIVDEETDATSDQYILETSLTIPANEYFGTITVSGVYDNLTTSRVNLVLIISSIEGDNPSISEVTHTVALKQV